MISIPFVGGKRTSYKYVKPIVQKFKYKSVYEPFGGSGVLSVNLYKDGLVDKAVVNDYDCFFNNYEQYLDYKDWIVEECSKQGFHMTKTDSISHYYIENGEKIRLKTRLLSYEKREIIQSYVKQIPKKYWRYLALGNNFCFSAIPSRPKVVLSDFCYFHSPLDTTKQREYLAWYRKIESLSLDYKDFIELNKENFDENSLLIIDPPYLNSWQFGYKGEFDLEKTKELIEILKDLKIDFIFFNDNFDLIHELLSGLNIVYENGVDVQSKKYAFRRKRKDCFALVQF